MPINRRTTLKWVMAAAATAPTLGNEVLAQVPGATLAATGQPAARRYGTDPDLLKTYRPGELWPLTFTKAQRRTATALSDLIMPADTESPSASAVGVIDFIDEWVSAPYPQQVADRKRILEGFIWLDDESRRRFGKDFTALNEGQQRSICDEISYLPKAKPELKSAAEFFARYRDLTAGGFYTTPVGRQDLKFVGNVPRASFDGPPLEVLRKVGLV